MGANEEGVREVELVLAGPKPRHTYMRAKDCMLTHRTWLAGSASRAKETSKTFNSERECFREFDRVLGMKRKQGYAVIRGDASVPLRQSDPSSSTEPPTIALPHWYALLVAGAVKHAFSTADWLEHGAPKIAEWILLDLERLAENFGGVAASTDLASRIECSRDNVQRLGAALKLGFTDGHYPTPIFHEAWFVDRTVATLGLGFDSLAPIRVPRAVFQMIEAAVGAMHGREAIDPRLLTTLGRAGLSALGDRVRVHFAKPSVEDLLNEELSLATILAVALADDAEAGARGLDGLSLDTPRTYHPAQTYVIGDVIEHAKLGRGLVTDHGGEGKIHVRFAEGQRILVHARA